MIAEETIKNVKDLKDKMHEFNNKADDQFLMNMFWKCFKEELKKDMEESIERFNNRDQNII